MRLINLKRASNLEVQKWIEKSIPELTKYQKERIRDDEIVRFAPYEFYKRGKKVDNILVRLSVIFIPIVWVLLLIGLPFNFFVTGKWGYGRIEWYCKWATACGL